MKTIHNTTGYLLAALMLFLLTGCAIVDMEAGASVTKVNASNKIWTPQAYLKAPNAEGTDQFGYSVSISGDTIVVGANQEDSNQTFITTTPGGNDTDVNSNIGAAYVFVRSGETWTQQAYLKAPNAGAGDQFGSSVSVLGDLIIVGSPLEDSSQTSVINSTTVGADSGTATESGAAYVFVRSGTTWSHEAYLKAPNAGSDDQFGISTSFHSNGLVVGAWFEDSDQTVIQNLSTGSSNYGIDTSESEEVGAAYIFKRGTWSLEAYIKAPNAGSGDRFGYSISASHQTIVVGAYQEDSSETSVINNTTVGADPGTATDSGAAYVFVSSGTTWSLEAYLKAPNAGSGDRFGYSVSASFDTIVVGAPREDSNQNSVINNTTVGADPGTAEDAGAAYVFMRSGTTWSHQAYLKASNPRSYDYFGHSVSVSGETIVVGAFNEDDRQFLDGSGSAFVFVRSDNTTWSPQAYLKAPNAESNDQFGYSVDVSGNTIVVGAMREDSSQTTITNGTTVGADPGTASDSGAAYVFVR